VTTEGAGAVLDSSATAEDGTMFCYRHPDRETWVRCGRCDRPICTKCAMQGPVGFRCRNCGTLANDPLSTIRPTQAVIGLAVAIGLGAGVGLIASRIGFFTIIVSFIAGGFIAEAVTRLIGYKRGTTILVIVLGGIVAGSLVGFGVDYGLMVAEFANLDLPPEAGVGLPASFFLDGLLWVVVSAGAACAGAYSRLR
jgi:hypothetical protein